MVRPKGSNQLVRELDIIYLLYHKNRCAMKMGKILYKAEGK